MHTFEYGTYFFRPVDNDTFLEAKFFNPQLNKDDYVKHWVMEGDTLNSWGIKDPHPQRLHFYFIETPCIIAFEGYTSVDYYLKTTYENGYATPLYTSLITKLIEIGFLVKLLPHEESASEFGLI